MPLDISTLPMPKKPGMAAPDSMKDYEGSDEEEAKESPKEEEGEEDLDDLTNKVLESIPDDKLIEECKKRGIDVASKDEARSSKDEGAKSMPPAPTGAPMGAPPSGMPPV